MLLFRYILLIIKPNLVIIILQGKEVKPEKDGLK